MSSNNQDPKREESSSKFGGESWHWRRFLNENVLSDQLMCGQKNNSVLSSRFSSSSLGKASGDSKTQASPLLRVEWLALYFQKHMGVGMA